MWQSHQEAASKKTKNWYVTIGIVAGGVALASFIVGNILFGFLILIGGFTVMLAGSRPAGEKKYGLSDSGVHLDERIIPWASVELFSINDRASPYRLTIKTKTLLGTTVIPLIDIDHRAVRTEFKNNNIEEVDDIDSFTEMLVEKLGL